MRFPELLYSPTDADIRKGAVPQRSVGRRNLDAAAVQLTTTFGPPGIDEVWILTSASVFASPGGAQTVTDVFLEVIDGAGTAVLQLNRGGEPGIGAERHLEWNGEVVIMPGERLNFIVGFSAAAVVNLGRVSYHAYRLPRGTFQHG